MKRRKWFGNVRGKRARWHIVERITMRMINAPCGYNLHPKNGMTAEFSDLLVTTRGRSVCCKKCLKGIEK